MTTATSVRRLNFRKLILRVWLWIGILTILLWAYPVAYRHTRLLAIVGVATCWAGALFLWWRRKTVRVPLVALAALLLVTVSLPGRPIQPESLARDYCRGLRFFRGVNYVWGGEGFLGIDCSGLVRQGLVWAQLCHGLRTVNGAPIRHALWLWWNDCSALNLRDGFGGLTREIFRTKAIAEADHKLLYPGDLAVTVDGVHVLAYLGNHAWIEADPNAHKVVELTASSNNPWFSVPVVLMRWKWLERN